MARVDFYVLPHAGEPARERFACRLAEKAWKLDNDVHIEVADEQAARRLDELLWTFRDGSFVPHNIVGMGPDGADAAITVGQTGRRPAAAGLLINLSTDKPDAIDSFARIAEIVTSDDDSRIRSRKHFAEYRDAGHELETHKL